MALCGTWVDDVETLCSCSPCDFASGDDPYCDDGLAVLERWALIASGILYAATGRQFSGVCTDTVRPCSRRGSCVQTLAYAASSGSRPLWLDGDAIDGCTGLPGCRWHSTVLLPHEPVRQITEVVIDGVTVDPSSYTLVDRRLLVRSEGSWPCCQDLGAPNGDPDTWSVTYEYGVAPPPGGPEIAGVYACELAKACVADESCRLPRRVQSITREGITQVLIDPFDFFDSGRTGLYEVDAWIKAQNPAGVDRAARVLNVDLVGRTHRVR